MTRTSPEASPSSMRICLPGIRSAALVEGADGVVSSMNGPETILKSAEGRGKPSFGINSNTLPSIGKAVPVNPLVKLNQCSDPFWIDHVPEMDWLERVSWSPCRTAWTAVELALDRPHIWVAQSASVITNHQERRIREVPFPGAIPATFGILLGYDLA